MSNEMKLWVRTADQTRRAEITVAPSSLGSEVIQGAVDNWSLPADTDYTLVNTTTGKVLSPREALSPEAVKPGDILEIQPVLVAGARR